MKRSGHIPLGELKVGIVLIIAFAIFLWAAFQGGFFAGFTRHDELHTAFQSVEGLVVGSPVWLNGVEVGSVEELKLASQPQKNQVLVTLKIERNVWHLIRTDSKVRVGTIGLIGDRYIEILAGSPELPLVQPGGFLDGEQPVDARAMFAEATENLRRLGPVLEDVKAMIRQLRSGKSSLGRLIDDQKLYDQLVVAVQDIKRLALAIDTGQQQAFTHINSLASALDTLTQKLNRGQGSAGKLIQDTTLYGSMSRIASRADTLFAQVKRGEGTLGKLANEEKLYTDLSVLVNELNTLIADIKKNPKKYFKFSVF